jgi:hypothetical protein
MAGLQTYTVLIPDVPVAETTSDAVSVSAPQTRQQLARVGIEGRQGRSNEI